MNIHLRHIYPIVLAITVGMLLIGIWFSPVLEKISLGIFVAMMLLTGIPHGATDHCIYAYNCKAKGERFSLRFFLLQYLLAVGIYAGLWYFFPKLSLGVFLLISSFHFGQAQLQHFIPYETKYMIKFILYVAWGAVVIGGIVLFNAAESEAILQYLFPSLQLVEIRTSWIFFVAVGIVLVLASWVPKDSQKLGPLLGEIMNLGLLLGLSYYADLLTSFGLYFGLWHAPASIQNEIDIFRRTTPFFTFSDFCRQALPFTLVSVLGIGMVIAGMHLFVPNFSPYLVFFIAIAALTLPHMYFMERFYHLGKSAFSSPS